MADDGKELILVMSHGQWHSRRNVVEADEIYGPAGETVAEQVYDDAVGDEDIYLRPRPPDMQRQSRLRYVLWRHGKLELGFRFPDAAMRREFKGSTALMKTSERIPGRFEIWSRNPNKGELKMLGDCLPVVLRNNKGIEEQWQLWQTMLCGQIAFQTVEAAIRELSKRHGRAFVPIMAGGTLPPSPPKPDVQRLELGNVERRRLAGYLADLKGQPE
jgi:hypothetical protein